METFIGVSEPTNASVMKMLVINVSCDKRIGIIDIWHSLNLDLWQIQARITVDHKWTDTNSNNVSVHCDRQSQTKANGCSQRHHSTVRKKPPVPVIDTALACWNGLDQEGTRIRIWSEDLQSFHVGKWYTQRSLWLDCQLVALRVARVMYRHQLVIS